MRYELPDVDVADDLAPILPLMEARGMEPGGPVGTRPPGEELDALREAVPDFRRVIGDSGLPSAVTTCDLTSVPYPTRFGFHGAAKSPAPLLFILNRMLVVQWDDEDGQRRTLLWEPSDVELGEHTPFFDALRRKMRLPVNAARKMLNHGTVLGHLRALGIDPADVDYLAFDHLHTQDVRRQVGTRSPCPDLGSPSGPLAPWFPNATLLVQRREWEAIRHLHPLQAPWYQPETYVDLATERIRLVDGDALLGPGVALMATPGHTAGNMSLVLRTDRGVWTSSENGIAAEAWAPHASRIAGLRSASADYGREVVMNANTLEFAAWQYNSMVVEALVADPTPEGTFRQTFPSSELVKHPLAPGVTPTFSFGAIEHGRIRQSSVAVAAGVEVA